MNVLVPLEPRLSRTPDGHVWTDGQCPYHIWQRYLAVFDGVRVLARVADIPEASAQHMRVDGPGVGVVQVPCYIGPWQYLLRRRRVLAALRSALQSADAIIMRVPSQLANLLFPLLRQASHPFGLEVVGDPWEVFAPGVVDHPLRPWLRRHFARALRQQCASACGAAYVTERTLQSRYPNQSNAYSTSFSSVMLPPMSGQRMTVAVSDVELSPTTRSLRPARRAAGLRKILLVGTLAQMYKGVDIALEATAVCVRAGVDLQLRIVGDGRFRPRLEHHAQRLGISGRVVFRGQLSGPGVQEELQNAELFIMPSRTEGLPRALIEAMATGLPCLGSAVGGIPELLPPEDLIPPGDVAALARKLQEVLADDQRMARMSGRNHERTRAFRPEVLAERRTTFYRFVRDVTVAWRQAGTGRQQTSAPARDRACA